MNKRKELIRIVLVFTQVIFLVIASTTAVYAQGPVGGSDGDGSEEGGEGGDGGDGESDPNSGSGSDGSMYVPADDPGGFSALVQNDGSIDLNSLTYNGQTSFSITGEGVDVNVSILGGELSTHIDGFTVDIKYDSYTTPSGETLLVPTTETMLYWSGMVGADGNPLNIAAETWRQEGITQGFFANENTDLIENTGEGKVEFTWDAAEFIAKIQSGELDDFGTMTKEQWNILMQQSDEAGFLITSMILIPGCAGDFGCDVGPMDGEEAAEEPLPPEVVYYPPQCPPPSVAFGDIIVGTDAPSGEGGKLAPDYPIVVGQDKERRGVDVTANVTVPPVIYTYFIPIPRSEVVCVRAPQRDGGNCGAGVTNVSERWGNPEWKAIERITYDCRKRVEVYTDYLAYVNISLVLSGPARAYIEGKLESVYPGAHVYQPIFNLDFSGPGREIGGQRVFWEGIWEEIPIRDPGTWIVVISGATTGTEVSAPRTFSVGIGNFEVAVIRVKLDR